MFVSRRRAYVGIVGGNGGLPEKNRRNDIAHASDHPKAIRMFSVSDLAERDASMPSADDDDENDDEKDGEDGNASAGIRRDTMRPTPSTTLLMSVSSSILPRTSEPSVRLTQAQDPYATLAYAASSPLQTGPQSLQPPQRPPPQDRVGRISQTTEHLLIAAGSIGATIIIVMIVLAVYTMRKRGLTVSDVVKNGKNGLSRRRGHGLSDYALDNKQGYRDDYSYSRKNSIPPPERLVAGTRSGSLSSQTRLQALNRSDSFTADRPLRSTSPNQSFLLDDVLTRTNSHRSTTGVTASSEALPHQNRWPTDSFPRNKQLPSQPSDLDPRYTDTPKERTSPPPQPPSFKQFMSNRPYISQRSGPGGAVSSRFSWTNSQAPQTPHDPPRDTVGGSVSRDSYMTSRSSVPRFRTVDSWVHQQSNRVAAQRIKAQFRTTRSSTYSNDSYGDEVPAMPEVPMNGFSSGGGSKKEGKAGVKGVSGLPGKNVKHQRHSTQDTAPVFRQHPGTEVRFSTQSVVPSEVLDMGRRNGAL